MSRLHTRAGWNGGTWWRIFRRRILKRDGHRCVRCGMAGRLVVDHVVPLHRGGDAWDPGNCQTLCHPCHREKTRRERGRVPDPGWLDVLREVASRRRQ